MPTSDPNLLRGSFPNAQMQGPLPCGTLKKTSAACQHLQIGLPRVTHRDFLAHFLDAYRSRLKRSPDRLLGSKACEMKPSHALYWS